jgi:hypothetical protein
MMSVCKCGIRCRVGVSPVRAVLTRIGTAAGVGDLVAASMPAGKPRRGCRRSLTRLKINEPMRDEEDHLALPLNAAAHSDHAGVHHGAAKLLEHLRPDHQVSNPGLVLQG